MTSKPVGTFDGADATMVLTEEGWALAEPLLEVGGTTEVTYTDGRQLQVVICGWDASTRRIAFLIPIDQMGNQRSKNGETA